MAVKKRKKPLITSNHPATLFLNSCFYCNMKPLLKNSENVYERLELLHQEGKEKRSPLNYLTYNEILDFIKENQSELYKRVDKGAIEDTAFTFAVALGWKQFKQVYRFNPTFLEELLDLDIEDDKNLILSRDEVLCLPCFNFFVEYEDTFWNHKYVGFFVYFDEITATDQKGQIHIIFIPDPKIIAKNENGYLEQLDFYKLTLLYDFDYLHIVSQDTGEVLSVKVTAKEMLRAISPNVFKELGEEKALELVSRVTKIVTYLCAVNADLNRVKKPTKKPDIKRYRVSDAENEVWSIGDRYVAVMGNLVNERYAGKQPEGIYERVRATLKKKETEDIAESITESKEKRKGYHQRPHMRRAHYQYYWYGKRDGSEERVKRRLYKSAIFVNATGEDIEIPTREEIGCNYRF